jgi:hypothetical protein
MERKAGWEKAGWNIYGRYSPSMVCPLIAILIKGAKGGSVYKGLFLSGSFQKQEWHSELCMLGFILAGSFKALLP